MVMNILHIKCRLRVLVSCALFALVTLSTGFASGTREQDYKTVTGRESWDYRYVISGLDPGTYNLLVQGFDKAGNAGTAGPINLFVDPKSDLPVASISTPSPGQRVGGDFTVVGTALDDDGIDRVEVSLDKTDFLPAQGRDYWSITFPVESAPDGPHTVSARAVDVNGTVGPAVNVSFNLDTRAPIVRVTSAESGVLVTGNLPLAGSVEDPNGIASLSYSADERKSWQPLGMGLEKDGTLAKFSLAVDTRRLKDGPHVYWVRAVDRTASVGTLAFLFFVDNTGPVVEILSPAPSVKAAGRVTVVGRTNEMVGIKSLAWNAGEAGAGQVELVPGNPFWAVDIDLGKVKGPSARVVFTAEDRVGNKAVKELTIPLQPDEADLPVVTLRSPAAGQKYGGAVPLVGAVRDDDGVKAIAYGLDGKPAATADCAEAFALALDGVAPGKHRLAVHGIDVNGRPGKDVLVEFTSTGAPPAVSLKTIGTGTASAPYRAGREIDRHRGSVLHGTIATLARLQSVAVVFNGAPGEKPALRPGTSPGQTLFDAKVPPTVVAGLLTVEVMAVDEYGQEARQRFLLHVANTSRRIGEPGIQFSDARIGGDGTVALGPDGELSGVMAGEEIASVSLVPGTDLVSVSADGDRILLRAQKAGTSDPVRVKVVTKKGHTFTTDPWRFVTDGGGTPAEGTPLIAVGAFARGKDNAAYTPGAMVEVGGGAVLSGTITASSVKTAEYSLAGAAAKPLPVRKAQKPGQPSAFDLPLPADLPWGKIDVRIVATDEGGRRAEFSGFFYRIERGGEGGDEEGLSFVDARIGADGSILLAPGDKIEGFYNGRSVTVVAVEPATPVVTASVEENNVIVLTAAAEGASGAVKVRITTADGDTVRSDALSIRCDAAAPELVVSSPAAGAWTGTRIALTGTATDTGGPVTVEYAVAGAETFTPVPASKRAAGTFEATIDLGAIPDGDVSLSVRATDAVGRTTVLTIPLTKDTLAPTLTQLTPPAGEAVNGLVMVCGTAEDAGAVEKAELSVDGGKTWTDAEGTATFRAPVDFSKVDPKRVSFRVTDRAGNVATSVPELSVQQAADIPVVDIQAPQDGDVQRSDFVVSGTALDDDGIGSLSWRLDGGEWVPLEGANTFAIPVALADLSDNEHTIEVKAEDLNGVASTPLKRVLRVSRAEPLSRIVSPSLSTTTRGVVTLGGESVDKNGIDEVSLSFDNGQTFRRVDGKEKWTYHLDTRVMKDGTYSVFIRARDSYGTVGLGSTLINVDNTPPEIVLDGPADGASVSDTLTVRGRSRDGIAVVTLTARIRPLVGVGAPRTVELPVGAPFSVAIDFGAQPGGWYDLEIEGVDRAANTTVVSRNLLVQPTKEAERVDLVFPASGETRSGVLVVSGRVLSTRTPGSVVLLVDGKEAGTAEVKPDGYFSATAAVEGMADGAHALSAEARFPEGPALAAEPHGILWHAVGPWVTFTSHAAGDWVRERPYIGGEAGRTADPADAEETDAGRRRQKADAQRLLSVQVSLDNGRTFFKADGTEKWRFRLETQSMADGPVRIMVKALYADGVAAVTQTILRLDDTLPQVHLLVPSEGGRFNETVDLTGTASDENGIEQVRTVLRKGDKAGYAVPGFIQGMYFDAQLLGATDWSVGAGLTFFDQNVKLQAQVGMAPEGRFSGMLLGAKLLANIARLPFSYFFGPDLDYLSASFALGANFSYATNSGSVVDFSGPGVILGGVVAQLEFPIFKLKGWTVFNTWSVYTEYQLWFISSDVSAGVVNRLSFGLRIGLL
jgi:hypothetical protein